MFVNGKLLSEKEASVSVFDHGLVVGDGVFETLLVFEGKPFAMRRHLERLQRSAAGLGFKAPGDAEVREAVEAVMAASDITLGRLRITVTAGLGPLGSGRLDGPPTLVVAAGELGEEHDRAEIAVVPWTRNEHGALAGLKTTSYAENALALAYAAERGADEAIFGNTAGMLCEGTGSNVFLVSQGRLITPTLSSGCLAGVTRALVLERHGGEEIDVPLEVFAPDTVDEAFLTSTLRGVQPISAIDGQPLEWPGPVTKQAAGAYLSVLAEIDP
ncbi:MAG: 4-amino-4-deoxychorismate lyase [Acidimicrobiaceae bacterium]|nr:4-amino-4-deoxychorismate lyase [Acidimicrobiaceae bacterium]